MRSVWISSANFSKSTPLSSSSSSLLSALLASLLSALVASLIASSFAGSPPIPNAPFSLSIIDTLSPAAGAGSTAGAGAGAGVGAGVGSGVGAGGSGAGCSGALDSPEASSSDFLPKPMALKALSTKDGSAAAVSASVAPAAASASFFGSERIGSSTVTFFWSSLFSPPIPKKPNTPPP